MHSKPEAKKYLLVHPTESNIVAVFKERVDALYAQRGGPGFMDVGFHDMKGWMNIGWVMRMEPYMAKRCQWHAVQDKVLINPSNEDRYASIMSPDRKMVFVDSFIPPSRYADETKLMRPRTLRFCRMMWDFLVHEVGWGVVGSNNMISYPPDQYNRVLPFADNINLPWNDPNLVKFI